MFGMGAGLGVASFRDIVRRRFAPLVGLLSQFGWMPLIAYSLAKVLALPPAMAISLLVVGCVPGGTTSNLFTVYAKSDVALSVSMTAISTITGVVVMPIVLQLYGAGNRRSSATERRKDLDGRRDLGSERHDRRRERLAVDRVRRARVGDDAALRPTATSRASTSRRAACIRTHHHHLPLPHRPCRRWCLHPPVDRRRRRSSRPR